MDTLVPVKPLEDFVLSFSYEGPSFEGQMPLHELAEELVGLEICVKKILNSGFRRKVLEINPASIELVIEAFEKGSFKKKLKFVVRKIEKYPTTSMIVAGAVALVANTIIDTVRITIENNPTAIREMSSGLMNRIGDALKVEMLSDQEFLTALSRVATPLVIADDKLTLTNPDNKKVVLKHENAQTLRELGGDEFELLDTVTEHLRGRVTRVDLTATKNALGFKVNDSGTTIPCSFLDATGPEEREKLLGKWIEVEGVVEKKGDERRHITVYSYRLSEQPEQTTMEFIE